MNSSPAAFTPKLDGFVAAAPRSAVCSTMSVTDASPVPAFTLRPSDQMRLDPKSAKT
jgi:hypothetical protein